MLVLVLIFSTWMTLTRACSCPPIPGLARFCQYDLIVRGSALAEYEERHGPYDPTDPFFAYRGNSEYVYSIIVTQAFKVPVSMEGAKMISIRSPAQFSMCGVRLALDVDAVFFGYVNHKGHIQTGMCAPNADWENLSWEDRALITDRIVPFCANKNSSEPIIRPPSPPSPPGFNP